MHQVACEVAFVKLVQVKISQVVVGNLLGKHVIDGHQNFVGDSDRCSLVAAAGFETVELVSEISAFGPGCGIGGLD